jgi:nucleoside-diphosphate-sugar epimerase
VDAAACAAGELPCGGRERPTIGAGTCTPRGSSCSKIAVAGATGRVGRQVADVLEAEGHDVVPMSRSGGVDVITGDGLADALTGVDTIIDVATGPSSEQEPATEFFTTAARNLQEAGERAGVPHMGVVSIIGTDRFSAGYNAAKVAHEQAAIRARSRSRCSARRSSTSSSVSCWSGATGAT